MVLVFTLLSKHGDQNTEARAVSAGALWFFSCPGADQLSYWLLSSEFL